MDTSSYETQEIDRLDITIYGGGKDEIRGSIEEHFGTTLALDASHTWTGVGAAKQTIKVTSRGGLEAGFWSSSGECTLIVIALTVILSLIVLWQLIMFFIVILVLSIFSGGAALKYTRSTQMTALAEETETATIEAFTKSQIAAGRFVLLRTEGYQKELGPLARAATRATQMFRIGIIAAVAIASVFLVVEVAYWILYRSWLTDIIVLLEFGLAFLFCIILTDAGVLRRRGLRKDIEMGYVEGPLRERT